MARTARRRRARPTAATFARFTDDDLRIPADPDRLQALADAVLDSGLDVDVLPLFTALPGEPLADYIPEETHA